MTYPIGTLRDGSYAAARTLPRADGLGLCLAIQTGARS